MVFRLSEKLISGLRSVDQGWAGIYILMVLAVFVYEIHPK